MGERKSGGSGASRRLSRRRLLVARLAKNVRQRAHEASPSWLDSPGPFELRWTGFDVEGSRALRDLELRFPSRLTVLVGINGAGKSTALDVGAFVAHALRFGLPSALQAENGVARMRSRGSNAPISVRLHFEVDLGTGPRPAEYGFVIDERYAAVQVEREALITRADETPVTWLDRKRAIAHVPLSDAELRHTVYPRLDDLYLGCMSDRVDYPIASGILRDLCRTLLIDRDPDFSALAPSGLMTFGERRPDPVRTRWAATIAELLDEAIPGDEAARRLGSVLAELVPTVREVRRVVATGEPARFEIVEADSPEPARLDELSAGMRQMLLLAAVYIHPRPPALLLLEEPDAGIHVGAYQPMRDLLRSIAKRSVVLATSHSPYFVGLLDPEREVVVLDRDERGVHARSLEEARRSRRWLESFEHPAEAFVRLGMERKR
jgi:predicted ATPase